MKIFYVMIVYLLLTTSAFAEETLRLNASVLKTVIKDDVVVYNLSNGKLHTPDCEWAEKCTKNCIYISKKDLKKMFFIPCIVCGGGVIEPTKFDDDK